MAKNRRQFLRLAGATGTVGLLASSANSVTAYEIDGPRCSDITPSEIVYKNTVNHERDGTNNYSAVSYSFDQTVALRRKNWDIDDNPAIPGVDKQSWHKCDLLGLTTSNHDPYHPEGLIENIGIRMNVDGGTTHAPDSPRDTKAVVGAPLLSADEIGAHNDIDLTPTEVHNDHQVKEWVNEKTSFDNETTTSLLDLAAIAAGEIAGSVHPAGSIVVSLATLALNDGSGGSWELDYKFNLEKLNDNLLDDYERAAVIWVADFMTTFDDPSTGEQHNFDIETYIELNHHHQEEYLPTGELETGLNSYFIDAPTPLYWCSSPP